MKGPPTLPLRSRPAPSWAPWPSSPFWSAPRWSCSGARSS